MYVCLLLFSGYGSYFSLAKRTQTDTFWKKHCHAVSFIKTEDGPSQNAQAEKIVCDPPRLTTFNNYEKPNSCPAQSTTCTRCKVIMYPGKTNSPENHKRGYCSDGVQQKEKSGDFLPRWPQPPGIFTNGR